MKHVYSTIVCKCVHTEMMNINTEMLIDACNFFKLLLFVQLHKLCRNYIMLYEKASYEFIF